MNKKFSSGSFENKKSSTEKHRILIDIIKKYFYQEGGL